MKFKRLIVAILAMSFEAKAGEWTPPENLLQAICQIESSNGRYLYGDGGRSLGHFQLSKPAWKDVSAWRKARGLNNYPYSQHVMNPFINREYAANYLTMLHAQLQSTLRREPTGPELYAAYNIGYVGFAKSQFDLTRINRTTQNKCRQIAQILAPSAPAPAPLASVPPSPVLPKKS